MLASLSWWLVIQLFALAVLPLGWRLFGRLPSRGYPLLKALGLLLVAYVLWMGATLHVLPNTVGGAAAALLLVAGLSAWIGRAGLRRAPDGSAGRPLLAWLRANWPLLLATELLFALVFAGWVVFRAYNPEIAGTEKPMEFAFINGVLRSRFFPPQDPWLAGYGISYYYFGYVMLALLIRLTGVDPAVGFNLGVGLWYGLIMVGAFGVVYDLVLTGRRTKDEGPRTTADRRPPTGFAHGIGLGVVGALFVGFIGNLEGLAEAAYHRGIVPLSWIKWLDIKQLTDTPPTGAWTGGFWWWWRASRVIHDRDLAGNSVEVIDEFPFFSFLLGDLHPHVLALPFVLLAIGLALHLFLEAGSSKLEAGDSELEAGSLKLEAGNAGSTSNTPRTTQHVSRITLHVSRLWEWLGEVTGLGAAGIVLAALILGALGFLNTWDFPIYVSLTAAAIGAGLAWTGGLTRGVVGRAAGAAVLLAVLGWVLYLPFYIGFQSQLGGVLPNLLFPSRFSQFFVMFGLFLVVVLFLLAALSRGLPRRSLGQGFLGVFPRVVLAPILLVSLFLLVFTVLPQGRAFADTVLDNPAVRAAIGDRTMGQLAALVARLRLANPWTYLALAGLIGWVGALVWAAVESGRGGERGSAGAEEQRSRGAEERRSGGAEEPLSPSAPQPLSVVDVFVLLMIGLALLLAYGVEFVYLRDLFGSRMNTVFKFYYQAWVLLALASAYGLSRLAGRGVPLWLKAPAFGLAAVLVAGSLFYPLAALPSKAGDFKGVPTLDGLAFLRQSSPADVAAIEWIRGNLPPDAVVLEASGGSYSTEGAGRVSMSTGNPTLLGWDFHERQWRGTAYDALAAGRPEALEQIYRTTRSEELPALLEKWDADFVLIGPLERRKFGITDAGLGRFERALTRVYDKDGVRIYAR